MHGPASPGLNDRRDQNHDTDLAYEWAEDAWVIRDGHIAAQGSVERVMQQRDVLRAAQLRVPWLVEMCLAIRHAYPDLLRGSLLRSRDQMLEWMFNPNAGDGREEFQARYSGAGVRSYTAGTGRLQVRWRCL